MGISVNTALVVVGGMFGLLVLALILAMFTTLNGSRVGKSAQGEMALRTPLAMRMAFTMLGLLCTVGAPLLYGAEALNPGPHQKAMPVWAWLAFAFFMSMSAALGGLMFYAACPNDVLINLEGRTYRHIYGWPHKRKVEVGALDEMTGVYVTCVQVDWCYGVGIAWKSERKSSLTLGQFMRSGRADRFAEEMAAVLGLPLVEPPPNVEKAAAMQRVR